MRIRLVFVAAALASPLAAQGNTALYSSWSGLGGFDYQRYGFDKGYPVQSGSQWSLPLVLVAPLGSHASIDLTTHYAHTEVTDTASRLTHSGLTDTQLRLLYTIGAQRAVVSISVNLPTGTNSFPKNSYGVASGVSSTYLSFPVNNLGSGFGVTTGLAYATPAGGWNLGLAGSVRAQANYHPFTDDSMNYKPGLEGRVRFGADRLVGERGRLLLGLTFSTFSTDEFNGGSASLASFNPGSRFITEFGYAYSWGRSSVTFGAWDYYRLAGSSGAATLSDTKENVFNTEVRLAHQLSPRFTIEPLAAFRQWSPADYRGGRLYSFGANARFGLSDSWSGVVSGRLGTGWIYNPTPRFGRSDVTATGLSLYLRYQR